MAHSAQFNASQLLPVKPGLDSMLIQVMRDLEACCANPEINPDALQSARAALHRACEMLQTLALDGVVVFCEEIELLLQELSTGVLSPSPTYGDTLQRALPALMRYLDALAAGAGDSPLRLFPEYQELQQARGMEMAFEVDLFFPDLQAELPPSVLAQLVQGDPQALIKTERGKYQSALLRWLRQDNPEEALRSMRGAVQAVMGCVPQDQQRAFWWVACALLDCMIHQSLPPEQSAKKLLSRIDLQMKALAEGQLVEARGSLREMLYLVACSKEVSDTVAGVRQLYALESLLPQEGALPGVEAVLEPMRAQLEAAKEGWEQCVRERYAAPEFSQQLAQLVSLAERLERGTLQNLCRQIQGCVAQARSAEQIQHIAQDMAMALLLLGGGIEHYRHLGSEFHGQARILGQRLQAGIAGVAQDDNELADLVALYCRMEGRAVTQVLAGEILGNLQQAGQDLSNYFDDTSKRLMLTETVKLLHQAQGGLHMLSMDQPGQLLRALQRAVEYYFAGGSPAPDEAPVVAAALGALQAHMQNLAQGQETETAPLHVALQELQALQRPDLAPIPVAPEAAAQTVAPPALWERDELLEVFLEEAQEVLDSIGANLEAIRLQPQSHEPLVIIRRGFHTLKGSGRMVGLTDLAEVAWAVERAMNKWLQGNKFATPGVLKLILDAEAAFKGWVDSLRAHGSTQVEANELLSTARQIEAGTEPPLAQPVEPAPAAALPETSVIAPVEAPAATVAVPVAAIEPELPPAALAQAALSPSQLGIAMEEVAQHVAALLWHLTDLRESKQPAVSGDFLHEAHTLAAVSHAMGSPRIAELASALEQWLEAHMGLPLALSDAQLSLLEHTVAMLDDMSLAVRNRQEPQARPELVARLQADVEAASGQMKMPQPAPREAAPEIPAPQERAEAVKHLQPAMQERVVQDDVDEHLLPIFLEEANDLLPQVGGDMRAWFEQPDEKALGRSLQRSLHTLKGSARMAGAMHLGDLIHHMEELVVQAMAQARYEAAALEEVEDYFDRIGGALEDLHSGERMVNQANAGMAGAQDASRHTGAAPSAAAERAMLRVRSDMADKLVGEAGEISVARSRAETELRGFKGGLLELADSVNRLREQLREIEIQAEGQMQARVSLSEDTAVKFDPLEIDRFTRLQELTRFMNESVHDVLTVQQSLLKNLDTASAALSTQSYLNRELQQNLMALRMVPFSNISERLHRIVRQACKDLNKKASLELRGTAVELDRGVLDRMTAPLEHLLRNAIAHGIESQQQRERAGKPSGGIIFLSLRQEGNEVVFEFSDDGAGINLVRLRQKALEFGLPPMDKKAGDEQVMQLIFTPGLTTATVVTEVSGRGVGMDVVRSEVAALGGRIEVSSKRGEGTRFVIHLPLTMVATQALLVRAGQSVYVVPASMVEQVQQLKPAALKGIYHQGRVEWKAKSYTLHYLPRLLGKEECMPESHPYNRVLLLRSGEQRLAIHVDDLVGSQEVLVKNAGPQLAHLAGIAGATVLGNGDVALVINPVQLAQRITGVRKTATVEPVLAPPLVMVVDDSLTVRKITSRLLARAGYQVVTAKDGVDALEQLGEISPAVMLLDIEMPRMDGFELTKHLRRTPQTQHLPIIMITSRTAEKHREYAQELGVNAYLGKPYQEEELLHHIAGLVAASC